MVLTAIHQLDEYTLGSLRQHIGDPLGSLGGDIAASSGE
jgi:hypothetical protein